MLLYNQQVTKAFLLTDREWNSSSISIFRDILFSEYFLTTKLFIQKVSKEVIVKTIIFFIKRFCNKNEGNFSDFLYKFCSKL